jgi:hypothetical protein
MNSIEGVVRKLLFIFIAVFSTIVFQSSTTAITTSVPVELTVPETLLRIQGLATPNALVTVKEGGSVIVSTTADSSGTFSALVARTAGLHTITVDYKDVNGASSLSNTQTISVQPQQTTTLDLFLSPTITRGSSGAVLSGSIVQLRGYTIPDALVTLRIDYNSFVFEGISDGNGFYEFLIDSSLFGEGKRIANVITTKGASISDVSRNIQFEVQSISGPSVPDIIVTPSQLAPPTAQSPTDGAVIDGDRVTITGDSVPNAQINIYENGRQIGSVFSNEFGKWSFEYIATSSPVTLSFEACVDGRCSVLSKTLTLVFSGIKANCQIELTLKEYRFWGIKKNQQVVLTVDEISKNVVIEINWGDNRIERFDQSNSSRTYDYSYGSSGNFNGSITATDKIGSNCKQVRYFSVLVSEDDEKGYFNNFLLMFLILAGILLLRYVVSKDKQSTIQNH